MSPYRIRRVVIGEVSAKRFGLFCIPCPAGLLAVVADKPWGVQVVCLDKVADALNARWAGGDEADGIGDYCAIALCAELYRERAAGVEGVAAKVVPCAATLGLVNHDVVWGAAWGVGVEGVNGVAGVGGGLYPACVNAVELGTAGGEAVGDAVIAVGGAGVA